MDLETFLELTIEEVAGLVRASGRKVCVFPINGTRRWFLLEHASDNEVDANLNQKYVSVAGQRHIELYRMIFEHGVDTLLTPIFGSELLNRGEAYVQMALGALEHLTTHPDFLSFYDSMGVRVRFYGDYRKLLSGTRHAHLIELFDNLTKSTQKNCKNRLFFGVFADEAVIPAAELAIQYYQQYGCTPDKRALIEMYYGEYVEPVSLFVGFDRFWAFDMPLVSTGSEDLYFTVCPSLYLTSQQLRLILYDHLYARQVPEPDYQQISQEALKWMKTFYRKNQNQVQGVGLVVDGFWYPLPQVSIPVDL